MESFRVKCFRRYTRILTRLVEAHMKKKKALVILLALIVAASSVWRIWPHSLREIIGASDEPFDSIIIHISEKGVADG